MTCPHPPGECRCFMHEMGLAKYAPDVIAYLEQLAKTDRPRPQRHLAAVPVPVIKEAHPFGQARDHQPWMPRPARKRAA